MSGRLTDERRRQLQAVATRQRLAIQRRLPLGYQPEKAPKVEWTRVYITLVNGAGRRSLCALASLTVPELVWTSSQLLEELVRRKEASA